MATETRIPANAAIPTAESDLGPYHPRASGHSYDPEMEDDGGLMESAAERGRRLAAQGADYAEDAWRSGRRYMDEGQRQVSRWAHDNPTQLWVAIAAVSAFALWMAYRPVTQAISRAGFDPSRYRYPSPRPRRPGRTDAGRESETAASSPRPSDSAI